jgi:hypothetical protein
MMRISENIRTSFNQDGAVLMDIQGGSMLTLNPIGSIIWQQLSDGRSPEQIAEHLALEFGISREQTLTDVNEFVEQLQAQHLIEPSERQDFRVNLGPKPTGLFCNLFGRRSSHAVQDRGPK